MAGLNTSELELILIDKFKPLVYEKAELTEEEKKQLEEESYPGENEEAQWMEDHDNARRLLPLFAAYQDSGNLDMLRKGLTGMSSFSSKGMYFLRAHPEISEGFLPFAANYIETVWTTPDETFMKVLKNSEKLKSFSKSRPTHMEVPDGRPVDYVYNYFSLGIKGDGKDDVKETFQYLMKKGYPNHHLKEISDGLTISGDKNEDKLKSLTMIPIPLGKQIELIGHCLEKGKQIEENGLKNLFFEAYSGLNFLEEKENGNYVLRMHRRVPGEFEGEYHKDEINEDANILKDWFSKAGLYVREESNLPGELRLGYSFNEQEKKVLASMTEEGRKNIELRERAKEKLKNNKDTRHYQVYDAHSLRTDYTIVDGSLKARIRHSTNPSEKGIKGGRIMWLSLEDFGKTIREYKNGEWKENLDKVTEYTKKDMNILQEYVVQAFN